EAVTLGSPAWCVPQLEPGSSVVVPSTTNCRPVTRVYPSRACSSSVTAATGSDASAGFTMTWIGRHGSHRAGAPSPRSGSTNAYGPAAVAVVAAVAAAAAGGGAGAG